MFISHKKFFFNHLRNYLNFPINVFVNRSKVRTYYSILVFDHNKIIIWTWLGIFISTSIGTFDRADVMFIYNGKWSLQVNFIKIPLYRLIRCDSWHFLLTTICFTWFFDRAMRTWAALDSFPNWSLNESTEIKNSLSDFQNVRFLSGIMVRPLIK